MTFAVFLIEINFAKNYIHFMRKNAYVAFTVFKTKNTYGRMS